MNTNAENNEKQYIIETPFNTEIIGNKLDYKMCLELQILF